MSTTGIDFASVDEDLPPNFPSLRQSGVRFSLMRAVFGRNVDGKPYLDPTFNTYAAPANCAAFVIDREMLRRRGAMTLTRTAFGYAIEANRPQGVNRPWSPVTAEAAMEGEAGNPASTDRLQAKRSIDATPSDPDMQLED